MRTVHLVAEYEQIVHGDLHVDNILVGHQRLNKSDAALAPDYAVAIIDWGKVFMRSDPYYKNNLIRSEGGVRDDLWIRMWFSVPLNEPLLKCSFH